MGTYFNIGSAYMNRYRLIYTLLLTALMASVNTQAGVHVKGSVYGGGNEADVKINTIVNIGGGQIEGNVYGGGKIGTVGTFTTSINQETGSKEYDFTNNTGICTVTISGGTVGPATPTETTPGNVFGGGKGEAKESGDGAFLCEAALVDAANVIINNGTVNGTVYGGGEIGRVNHNTEVTIGSATGTSTPEIKGSVFGAGKGLSTHGYSALVRGNSKVTVQGTAKVRQSVYGGGEIASVGKYTLNASGRPTSLANQNSGYCTVIVKGNAEIGPENKMSMITESGFPDDAGHVFGAGMGVLPYEGVTGDLWRMQPDNTKQWFVGSGGEHTYVPGTNDNSDYKQAYLDYIETLGLATQTYVTISENAFVKGSVYGGSMNGHVQHHTNVTIAGGQIGCGKNTTERYDDEVWEDDFTVTGDLECASWEYKSPYAPYDIYDLEGGKPKPATNGHTFYGNVFGGGSGFYPYSKNPDFTSAMAAQGYGDGLWHREAGSVGGNTVVNITGGHILSNVYGGNEQTDVTGSCTINMSGGTVGVPRTEAQMKAHPVTCYVFGGGKGDQRINFNTWTNVASTQVNISGNAHIYGSTYGGGENGHVLGDAVTNIGGSFTMTIDNVATTVPASNNVLIGTKNSTADGNVFGGGQGAVSALTAGVVGGNVSLSVQGGHMLGSVYGGGQIASVGTNFANVDDANYGKMQDGNDHGCLTVNLTGGTIDQNVYGGCMGANADTSKGVSEEFAAKLGLSKTVEVKLNEHCKNKDADNIGTTSGCVVKGDIFGCNNVNSSPLQTVTVHVYGTQNAAKNNIVTKFLKSSDDIDNYATLCSIKESIAGLNSSTETPTEKEAQFNSQKAIYDNENSSAAQKQAALAEMKAIVLLAIAGELGVNTDAYTNASSDDDKQTVLGNIEDEIADNKYDVHAVYGGGNLAAYKPIGPNPTTTSDDGKNTAYTTNVIIDGCGLTSIQNVYGGGNAASTPATVLTINGTYEIEEVFGGGNGKDKLPSGADNPGANVGFYDYSAVESTYPTKEARASTAFVNTYTYGTGKASVNIFGGTIHRVFGGSNTKGNVRQTAVTMLDENSGCNFCVDEAYGGGKSAPMDAEAKLLMACIPGLQAAYGGAEAADIQGNVTLNITNGTFDRVFGGNNLSGTISGSITVNIEEIGCRPIIIGELYGGGNQAAYSVYGYKAEGTSYTIRRDNNDGSAVSIPATPYSTTQYFADPQVNVKSFTSIGSIFGGGYGTRATMVGSPTVNINEVVGTPETYPDTGDFDSNGYKGKDITIDGNSVTLPSHTKTKIGAINKVFGGGNAAEVIGNTNVNIGTMGDVFVVVNDKNITVGTTDVSNYYIRSGSGTATDPYNYDTNASDKAVEGVTYYEKKAVVGADIRGNVYGGGNNAEVTGDTNVTIGKKATP